MAPFFFFDFTLDKTALPPVEEIPETLPLPKRLHTEPNNLCPYPIPKIEQIVKDIEKAAYAVDTSKFVSNLFECGAIAISNAVDLAQKDNREEKYLQIIRGYRPAQQRSLVDIFGKVFALLSSVIYDNGRFNDNLGEIFMSCGLINKRTAQFFTPYSASVLAARINIDGRQLRAKLLYGGERHRPALRSYDLSATRACGCSRHCQAPEHLDKRMLGCLVNAGISLPIPAFPQIR